MKRLFVLLALAGALAAPGRVAAQSIPVGIGGQLSSLVNLPITVPVVADLTARTEKLGSFALRVSWNPAVLQVLGGSDGTFGGVQVNDDSLPYGIVRIAGANPAGAGGLVTLVNVRLLPLVKDTTTLTLTLTELYAAGTFADLLPSAVTTGGLFCPARGRWGDIDGDGNANSRDALIALSNAVGLDVSAFDITLGDVDANGVTNARDALIVLSNAVGIDTGVFRVLRLAGGSCSSNAPIALTVTPAAVSLVVGQTVHFEAWAPDSATGALQAVPDASWRSSASALLAMGPTGDATARDTGTVTVTAYRGTRDSARTTAHIVARRTTHWVDALAVNARNRLGSPELPFGALDEAVAFAQAGDTLRIRVGHYELPSGTLNVDRPLVLIGDTAADGSRPTLAGAGGLRGGGDGIDLVSTGGRVEVQYLQLDGFTTGLYVGGPDCVLVRGVRMSQVTTGVDVESPAHCVRVEASTLVGASPEYAYGQTIGGVVTLAPVDTLVVDRTEIGGFAFGVLLLPPPDSTAIRHSSIHDAVQAAVANSPYIGGDAPRQWAPSGTARPAAPRAPSPPVQRGPMGPGDPVVIVDSSRLVRTAYSYEPLVGLNGGTLDFTLAHSYLSNPGGYVFYLYNVAGGALFLRADSIIAPPEHQHDYWMYAEGLDSLVADSLQVSGATSGYLSNTSLVRLTNSTLRDIRNYALEVAFASSGQLALDNVGVYGDARDDASATAVNASNGRVDVNRLTAVNLSEGIDGESDSSLTVANSQFQHVRYPVYWYPSSRVAPGTNGVTVQHSTFDGFDWAVEAYDGRMAVDSSTFTSGNKAIYLDSPRPISVTHNQVSGVASAIELYSYDSTAVVTVADNTVTAVPTTGIYVAGDNSADSLTTRFDILRNAVSCNATGATSIAGIDLLDARHIVLDNQVTNCFAGIRTIVSLATPRTDSIVGNTVSVPAGAQLGIGASGRVRARVGRNTVSGPTTGIQSAGLIDVLGNCGSWYCPEYDVPLALVDSNTVTGGTVWGIHANAVDSLAIVGNTVTNLVTPTGAYQYSEDQGGIAALGYLQYFAQIVGNVVRHIAGNGIVLNSNAETVVALDSNVVADIDSTGVYLAQGAAALEYNLVTGARRDGVRSYTYGSVTVNGNNIAGNLPYGVNIQADVSSIDGTGNWWGDALGPRCFSGCDPASAGDSVNNVDFAGFLAAPSDQVPPLPSPAPRLLAQAVSASVPPVPTGVAAPPFRHADRTTARAARPAPRAPGGTPVQGTAAGAAERARVAAERAARLQELQARRAARERARQAVHAPPAAARRQEVRP